MNEIIQSLLSRRSIKKYKPDPVPEDLLEQILACGMNAPTGMNRQSPVILAVTAKTMRDRLSKMNAAVMGVDSDPFYGAPVCLVVLADKSIPTYLYDGSLVMANLMAAAHALGLGACWIHRAKEEFQSPEGKAILKELGVTGDYEGIGHCIIGYPACPPPAARPRKDGYVKYI